MKSEYFVLLPNDICCSLQNRKSYDGNFVPAKCSCINYGATLSRHQNFVFSSFFSKSRGRASSEVQTQTNCYVYGILPPVITATDLTSQKHDGQTEVSACEVIGGFRSSAFVSFFAFAVCPF